MTCTNFIIDNSLKASSNSESGDTDTFKFKTIRHDCLTILFILLRCDLSTELLVQLQQFH